MKRLLLLLLSLAASASPARETPDRLLLPTPKKASFSAPFTVRNGRFRIDDRSGTGLDAAKIDLFARTLKERLGWEKAEDAPLRILLERKEEKDLPREYCELSISPEAIRIAAADDRGMMRGLARLQAMTLTPLFAAGPGNSVTIRSVRIADWPDNDLRIFQINLRQVFPETPKEVLLKTAEELIDRAAEMLFSHVMFVVGGSMELAGHPEINPPGPVFTKEEIRRLAGRAELRGLIPGPMLNSIGHAAAGPYICPVCDDKDPQKVIGTNVADKNFDPLFFRYLDELTELFPGTPFLGIGTDEFHKVLGKIEKLSGRKCGDFYPEYVNKVSARLKKRGIRIMIYHDMLGPQGRYKWPVETLNGPKDAMETLKKFDKDVIVGYWNYFHAKEYPFVKDLFASGFRTVWFTGWYGQHAVEALFRTGHRLKQPLFTTQWSAIPAKNEFVHGAEFSWNAGASPKTMHDFNDLNTFYFHRRPRGNFRGNAVETPPLAGGEPLHPEYAKQLTARLGGVRACAYGIPVDLACARGFHKAPGRRGTVSWDRLAELAAKGTLKDHVFFTPRSVVQRVIGRKSGVNAPRKQQKVIFYTSSFGPSTRTDARGVEFAVDKNGVVTALSGNCSGRSGDETGDMRIPEGGFVVSWNEAQPCFFFRSNSFYQTLRKGDRLTLARRGSGKMTKQSVTAKFSRPRGGAAVFLGAVSPMDPVLPQVKIRFHFSGGGFCDVPVTGSDFIASPNILKKQTPWNMWIASPLVRHGLFPVLAVEMDRPSGAPPVESVSVRCSASGLEAGICVLGVTGFDEDKK
ncbi:MAG: hypothetical protein IJU70_00790 [Lentisphaeria bacterium]|nr:hypothetical protein [Lentisphaeria bacterium]